MAVPSLISSATSLPSMAAKKAESLASSTSAETAFLERKRRERQRGVDGFARLATVRTRAAGGGRDARGDAQRWITRRHIPEARTALTSASEGESLPPSCACCREGDGREKGLAENPNTRKHERGRSREGRARRAGSDDIQRATRKPGERPHRQDASGLLAAVVRRARGCHRPSGRRCTCSPLSEPRATGSAGQWSHTRYAPAGKRRRTSSLRLR